MSVLRTLFTEGPRCGCSYFAPDATGNVFPILRRTAIAIEAHATNATAPDPLATITETVRDVWRAAKLCGSPSCRTLTNTAFDLVDTLVNTNTATAPPMTVPATCASSTASLCWSSTCFPFDGSTAQCEQCYQPTTGATQMSPMALIDDKSVDRTLFWASCFVSTDCPPEGVRGFELRVSFTVQGLGADAAAAEAFKRALVEILAPPGSSLEGTVAPGDIQLVVVDTNGDTRVVEARINVVSEAVRDTVTSQLGALTPSSASDALGLTVIDVSDTSVETLSFAPPSPPLSAPTPPESGAAIPRLVIIIASVAGGAAVVGAVLAVVCAYACSKKRARDAAVNVTISVDANEQKKKVPPAVELEAQAPPGMSLA